MENRTSCKSKNCYLKTKKIFQKLLSALHQMDIRISQVLILTRNELYVHFLVDKPSPFSDIFFLVSDADAESDLFDIDAW